MSDDVPESVREFCYERDRKRCRVCGTTNAYEYHLHHIRYRSEGGPHTPENLILLCGKHHREVHANKRKWQPLLLEVLKLGRPVTAFQLLRWKIKRGEG